MKRLAILTSHPIQYYAPIFAAPGRVLDVHVFYGHRQTSRQQGRLGFSARYRRLDRLLTGMNYARGDGRYAKLLAQTARTDVLCIDDFRLR